MPPPTLMGNKGTKTENSINGFILTALWTHTGHQHVETCLEKKLEKRTQAADTVRQAQVNGLLVDKMMTGRIDLLQCLNQLLSVTYAMHSIASMTSASLESILIIISQLIYFYIYKVAASVCPYVCVMSVCLSSGSLKNVRRPISMKLFMVHRGHRQTWTDKKHPENFDP